MCLRKLLIGLFWLPLFAQGAAASTPAKTETRDDGAVKLRALIEASPKLPLEQTELVMKLPKSQELGMVSWLARDAKTGVTWLIQRGDKADPVIAVDKEGRVLRSFGKGLYKVPHAIRLDPEGNAWTVDAGSSTVIKFSPKGEKLLEIDVGGVSAPAISAFRGTTNIAFAAKGRIFISDGYANARILEYTADGKKVREWGSTGAGPGQFHLPHSIVVDENNMLYVAERENGRIENFDLDGKFLGEIPNLGRTYSLKLGTNGTVWAGMQPLKEPPGSPGWVVQLDRKAGKILGYVPVNERGRSPLRGGRRRGSACDGRWDQSRLVQEALVAQRPKERAALTDLRTKVRTWRICFMVNAFGRLETLATAIVVGSSIFYPPAYIHSPAMQSQTSVREQSVVEAAYKAYLRAWKDKDYAALDRLLSDDYKAVNFRGIVSTKATEIATAKEDHDYADMKGDVMSVTLFGDSAVASGLIDARWKDEHGQAQKVTVRFLAVLSKQKGEWKLVATQSTRFNKPSNG